MQPQQPGYAPPPKPGMSTFAKVMIAFGVMGALAFGTCATCAVVGVKGVGDAAKAQKASDETAKSSAVAVDLKTLLAEYKDNEVRADQAYKGKYVRLSGQVDNIKKGLGGGAFITVGTGKAFEIPQVQCSLNDAAVAAASQLSKGAAVTVTGKITGLMMNVQVGDCSILP